MASTSKSVGSKVQGSPAPTRKRTRDESNDKAESSPRANKALKSKDSSKKTAHPFFTRKDTTVSPFSSASFQWLPALSYRDDIDPTCHHGVHLQPKSSTKVAAFDLDGTLIRPKNGGKFPKDEHDWEFWHQGKGNEKLVPNRLKELFDDGYSIVIISNQAIPSHIRNEAKRKAYTEKWQKKIPLIAQQLPDIPFRVFGATAKDQFRKPLFGTWLQLEKIFAKDGVQIDLEASFYVGDAAGRPGDHNVSDRLFAVNVGLPFHTPEEFFLGHKPREYKLERFRPIQSDTDCSLVPFYTPTSTPLVPTSKRQSHEIVLFVGYPSAGKSTLYHTYFKPAGYIHINQDTLKSKQKCLSMVKECLERQESCVIDNTNRDRNTRSDYVKLAQEHGIPIRAVYFDMSLELAWHLNIYRTFCLTDEMRNIEAPRTLVPYTVYTSFRKEFEMPSKDEGFGEVKTINWIFQGGDEERRRFHMYLDIF